MFNDWQYVLAQDRAAREQDLAEKIAERGKYARSPGKPSLRARLARRLFELAVAAESEEIGGQGAPVERAPSGRDFYRRFL
jgi:hypothetical protein